MFDPEISATKSHKRSRPAASVVDGKTMEKISLCCGYFWNVCIYLSLVVATLALRKGVISPVRRGFQCSDGSIQLPEKPESVSTGILLFSGVLFNLLLITLSEYFLERSYSEPLPRIRWLLCCNNPKIRSWVSRTIHSVVLFVLGLGITVFLTELGKISTGILRPNFLAICRPNVTCGEGDGNKYHYDYVCNATAEAEHDGRLSFPSGHATFVSYVSLFAILYIQWRSPRCSVVFLLRPFIQLVAFSCAWVICLTRVSDYVHHASDVIIGAALGSGVAFWTLTNLLRVNPSTLDTRQHSSTPCTEKSIDLNGGEDNTSMKISLKSCNASESTSDYKSAAGLAQQVKEQQMQNGTSPSITRE